MLGHHRAAIDRWMRTYSSFREGMLLREDDDSLYTDFRALRDRLLLLRKAMTDRPVCGCDTLLMKPFGHGFNVRESDVFFRRVPWLLSLLSELVHDNSDVKLLVDAAKVPAIASVKTGRCCLCPPCDVCGLVACHCVEIFCCSIVRCCKGCKRCLCRTPPLEEGLFKSEAGNNDTTTLQAMPGAAGAASVVAAESAEALSRIPLAPIIKSFLFSTTLAEYDIHESSTDVKAFISHIHELYHWRQGRQRQQLSERNRPGACTTHDTRISSRDNHGHMQRSTAANETMTTSIAGLRLRVRK